ncbi:hypothetical protein BH11BAC7_BH11BAC7_05910 [soil metagenome]
MNCTSASPDKTHLNTLDIAVLHTLMYFDIFRHPLTTDEIHRNCQWESCSLIDTAVSLEKLQLRGVIGNAEGFWFLSSNEKNINLRLDRQERALQFQSKAKKYSRLIASFPFVRGVAVSGSLSKGTMDKDGDIDYFIITEPGRLWIARTMLVLFKKIFLLNSKKYFCVNYFIDSDRLTIPDRNLFVATEIAFLRPMINRKIYNEFASANKWVSLFYPNRELRPRLAVSEVVPGFFKRNMEKMLSKNLGEWLDEKCLRLTLSRWSKKFPHLSDLEFDLDFRSKKSVSKHHPQGFQRKVVVEIEKRKGMILEQYGILVPAMRWEWTCENDSVKKV